MLVAASLLRRATTARVTATRSMSAAALPAGLLETLNCLSPAALEAAQQAIAGLQDCAARASTADVAMAAPAAAAPAAGDAAAVAGKKRKRPDADKLATSHPPTNLFTPDGRPVLSPAARGFDMSQFRLRHVALHVAYLGHDYAGFASQEIPKALRGKADASAGAAAAPGSAGKRARIDDGGSAKAAGSSPSSSAAGASAAPAPLKTIESALFAALTQACLVTSRDDCGYTRCGRTDRGVSAAGQVISLRLRSKAKRSKEGDAAAAAAAGPAAATPSSALPSSSAPATTGAAAPAAGAASGAGARATTDVDHVDGDVDVDRPEGWQHAWRRADAPSNEGEPFPPPAQETDYAATLNSLLPPDIRVLGWADVPDDFSARFSAGTRVYRYYFTPRSDIDIDRMRVAGQHLVGVHDYRNYCKFDINNTQNFIREILRVRVLPLEGPDAKGASFTPAAAAASGSVDAAATAASPADAVAPATTAGAVGVSPTVLASPNVWFVEVVGRAFLWHQIRCVLAVLFHVARGYEEPEMAAQLLDVDAFPARPNYNLANEGPLCLYHCGFGEAGVFDGDSDASSSATGAAADVDAGSGWRKVEMDADDAPASSATPAAFEDACERPQQFLPSFPSLYATMHHSVPALRIVTRELEERWSRLTIEAALVRGVLDRLYSLPVPTASVVHHAREAAVAAVAAVQGDGAKTAAATVEATGVGMHPRGSASVASTAAAAAAASTAVTSSTAASCPADAGAASAAATMPFGEAIARYPLLMPCPSDAEYSMLVPPVTLLDDLGITTLRKQSASSAAAADSAGAGTGKPAKAAGGRPARDGSGSATGAYIPFAKRRMGMSVRERWEGLSDDQKKEITAQHPVNARKLAAALADGGAAKGDAAAAGSS